MTAVDWAALAFVALTALMGTRKGLLASALSVAGLAAGAVLGGRLAPHVLAGGSRSPYTPLVALAGAAFVGVLLEGLGSFAGTAIRARLSLRPLRAFDSAGGFVAGAAAGLVLVWVAGAIALHLPGQTDLRRAAQRSSIVRRLNEVAPPSRVLEALGRVDPIPAIAGPVVPVAPPDPRLLTQPGVREAAPSVVRVGGTACGLGVAGSGWVARPELVVTAAHVVAGQSDTRVGVPGAEDSLAAQAVAFDARNDVAVLRVPGLRARALPLVDPEAGRAVAILGYPEDGPFAATPGRIGQTVTVLSQDAYGRGPLVRTVTTVRGRVRHGNSGGPAVDATGAVETTIFASGRTSRTGFGVPDDPVRRALNEAAGPVSTGPCVR